MRTAIYCLEMPIGVGSAPLAVVAQRPGIIAMVWETNGSRLRVRFDETRLDPETLKGWLDAAGYPVIVYTLLRADGGPASPEAADTCPSLPWIELDGPPAP